MNEKERLDRIESKIDEHNILIDDSKRMLELINQRLNEIQSELSDMDDTLKDALIVSIVNAFVLICLTLILFGKV